MQSCQPYDDEINLLDIWHDLWQRRWLIIVITVLVTAVASAYAALAPRIYKAELSISPSTHLTFNSVTRIWPIQQETITSTTIFDQMVKCLKDNYVQNLYMNDNTVGSDIFKNLRVTRNKGKIGKPSVSISLVGDSPGAVAKSLDSYLSYVGAYTRRAVLYNLNLLLLANKDTIKVALETARRKEKIRLVRQIAWLNEQLLIANRLGIVKFPTGDLSGIPTYARGSEALQIEIDSLRQRKNIDDFVLNIPLLEEQLRVIDMFKFKNIELTPLYSRSLLKSTTSKRQPIISLGILIGLILGILAAFFAETSQRIYRKRQLNPIFCQ